MSLNNKEYAPLGPVACAFNLHDSQLSPQTGEALAIGGYVINNRSNANADSGLFERLPNAMWDAGYIRANVTPDYVANTAVFQSTTANAVVNVFTTTNNDGFLVQCPIKFSAISFVVNDAVADGTMAYQYYNGSAMVNVTPIQTFSLTTGSAAKTQAIFAMPSDWSKGTTTAVGTSNANAYALQCIQTTAGSDVVSISDMRVYKMIDFFPQMQTNNQLIDELQGSEYKCFKGSSVSAYFGGTANANSYVQLEYRAISRQV